MAAGNSTQGYERAKQILALAQPPAVLLVTASDNLRPERLRSMFAEKFFGGPTTQPSMRLSGEQCGLRDIQRIQDEFNSLSLFSPQRYLLIENIDLLKSEPLKELAAFVEKAVTGPVTLLCKGKHLTAANPLQKFLSKNNFLIALEELKGDELHKWAVKELKNNGVEKYPAGLLDALFLQSEGDLDTLAQLITHLSLYVSGNSATEEDVNALFPEKLSPNEYELLNLITSKKVAQAELLLTNLFRQGKNPFLLLSLFTRTYLTYFSLCALREKGATAQQMGSSLNLPPWLLQKHIKAIQHCSLASLRRNIESILMADSMLKNRSLGPETVLSQLVANLA